jgi:hypothetical protein
MPVEKVRDSVGQDTPSNSGGGVGWSSVHCKPTG